MSGLKTCPRNAKLRYNVAKVIGETFPKFAEQEYRNALALKPNYDQVRACELCAKELCVGVFVLFTLQRHNGIKNV